jgi:hypothetical protein
MPRLCCSASVASARWARRQFRPSAAAQCAIRAQRATLRRASASSQPAPRCATRSTTAAVAATRARRRTARARAAANTRATATPAEHNKRHRLHATAGSGEQHVAAARALAARRKQQALVRHQQRVDQRRKRRGAGRARLDAGELRKCGNSGRTRSSAMAATAAHSSLSTAPAPMVAMRVGVHAREHTGRVGPADNLQSLRRHLHCRPQRRRRESSRHLRHAHQLAAQPAPHRVGDRIAQRRVRLIAR